MNKDNKEEIKNLEQLQTDNDLNFKDNVEFFRFHTLYPFTHPNFLIFLYDNYALNDDVHEKKYKFPC
jgi:hypothetical protein